jgi:hypothetical protein
MVPGAWGATENTADLRVAGCWCRLAYLDVSSFIHSAGWRRVQCLAVSADLSSRDARSIHAIPCSLGASIAADQLGPTWHQSLGMEDGLRQGEQALQPANEGFASAFGIVRSNSVLNSIFYTGRPQKFIVYLGGATCRYKLHHVATRLERASRCHHKP